MSLDRRIHSLEENHNRGSERNWLIRVQFVRTVLDENGGRSEVPEEASYDETPIDRNSIPSLPGGGRIVVQWPREDSSKTSGVVVGTD